MISPFPIETALIEIRPTQDFGDHCAICCFEDAEYFDVFTSNGRSPTTIHKSFDNFIDAFKTAQELDVPNIWYNGLELLHQIAASESLLQELSGFYFDGSGEETGWLREQLGLAEATDA